ncbi:MAG: hypothetical protein JSW28_01355, partial [Thermoplasmata archaeon]
GTLIGVNQTIPFLMAGENYTVNITWLPSSPGTYEIYVAVDYPPPGTIMETNETNNIASKALKVFALIPPTLYIKALGDDIILNWTQPCTSGLSHYILYRATSQIDFDFNTEWVNTSSDHESGDPGPIPLRTVWNDTNAAFPGNKTNYKEQYYYVIRTVNALGEVSSTSRTVGKWTKTFPQGVSSFSLPLEPLEDMTMNNCLTDMNAAYIKWMDPENHTWLKYGEGGSNDTQMKVGEGHEVKFASQTNYTFTGMPGAMISFDDGIPFSGFESDSEAKNLTVTVEADGNVTLTWQEPASMGPGDRYEVYYSNTRDGFFSPPGIHYDLACPPINYGTNTTNIAGLGANAPGARLYFMVVPFNSLGIKGAGTYSIGIWTEEYLAEYDTFGIPLKLSSDQTVDWYCNNIPETVGMNYYIYTEKRWGWHSTRMPAGVYDPLLVITEGYQISTSNVTKFTFIGI